MAAATPSVLTWALPQGQAVDFPGEDGMILRSFRFVDLESPVEYFNTWLTPVPHFFVRNHMFEPTELDPHDWRPLDRWRSRETAHPEPRRAFQNRNSFSRQHSRMRRQRTQLASPPGPRHTVGQRRGWHRPLFRSTLARRLGARRGEAHRQARHVPRARRSSRQSPSLHSQHSHREGARRRYANRHAHERIASHLSTTAFQREFWSPAGSAQRPASGSPRSKCSKPNSSATS